MADVKPPMMVSLAWDGNLEFTGQAGKHEIGMDGASYTAPSPMQLLALSLAGCMAIDVVHILTRGRHALKALGATLAGERAPDDPKRFTKFSLEFSIATDAAAVVIDRAIQLSREKYCSVWNSLRESTELVVSYRIEPMR
jgi:putative redox protein